MAEVCQILARYSKQFDNFVKIGKSDYVTVIFLNCFAERLPIFITTTKNVLLIRSPVDFMSSVRSTRSHFSSSWSAFFFSAYFSCKVHEFRDCISRTNRSRRKKKSSYYATTTLTAAFQLLLKSLAAAFFHKN